MPWIAAGIGGPIANLVVAVAKEGLNGPRLCCGSLKGYNVKYKLEDAGSVLTVEKMEILFQT